MYISPNRYYNSTIMYPLNSSDYTQLIKFNKRINQIFTMITLPIKKQLDQVNLEQKIWETYINGNEEAISELYELFFDRLYLYGCTITSDPTFVQDAIQEIFLKLMQREKAHLKIANVRSYLFVAIRNCIKKELLSKERKRNKQNTYIKTIAIYSSNDIAEIKKDTPSFENILQSEINLLPNRQREILFLKLFEGLDCKEISEILGIGHQVARNNAYKGIKRIRSRIRGLYPTLLERINCLIFFFTCFML